MLTLSTMPTMAASTGQSFIPEAIRAELQEQLRVGDHPSYMAPLAVQLGWLSDAGFTSVDCYWKYLGFAIFGGVKG